MASLNSKLFALASKASKRTFNVRRKTEEGIQYGLKMEGFPTSLTTTAVAELASTNGARLSIRAPIGEAAGSGGGALVGTHALELVHLLASTEAEAAQEEPKPRRSRNRLAEGEVNPAEVNGTVS